MSAAAIDSLGFHLAIIGLGVFIGYLIHGGLVRVELVVRPPSTDGRAFFDTSPLFPLCMNGWLGGAALLRQLHHAQSARPSPHATPLGHRHGFLGGGRDLDHQRGGDTGGVRAVLPPTPGNSSPTRRSTAGGGGTRKPARDPIGYGREAMRWRMWSNWRQVSARSGGQSLKKYNRFDITDHHRSDMGPSKPRVAGSNPAGRAISRRILPTAQAGDHSCGHFSSFRPVTSHRRLAC